MAAPGFLHRPLRARKRQSPAGIHRQNAVVGVGIYDRMPVILGAWAWDAWLTPENASVEALKGLLGSCGAEGLVAYPVSAAVNRAGVEGGELIAEISCSC